ncbi:hypothetical protein IE077_002189, partial [Cardiosporidium cionae]
MNPPFAPPPVYPGHTFPQLPVEPYQDLFYPYNHCPQQNSCLLSRSDRERYEKESQAKQERERKEQEKQQMEMEAKKRRELREKFKDGTFSSLPGVYDYICNEEISYKGLCEKIYNMRIGKLRLIAALLDLNGWIFAKKLLNHMIKNLSCTPYYNFPVYHSMKEFIKWLITPILHLTKGAASQFICTTFDSSTQRYHRCASKLEQTNFEGTFRPSKRGRPSFDPATMPLHRMGLMLPPVELQANEEEAMAG